MKRFCSSIHDQSNSTQAHIITTTTKKKNKQYEQAGAEIVDTAQVWQSALVTKVRPPTPEEAALLGGRTLISTVQPAQRADLVEAFGKNGATVFGAGVWCGLEIFRGRLDGIPYRPLINHLPSAQQRPPNRPRPAAPHAEPRAGL